MGVQEPWGGVGVLVWCPPTQNTLDQHPGNETSPPLVLGTLGSSGHPWVLSSCVVQVCTAGCQR